MIEAGYFQIEAEYIEIKRWDILRLRQDNYLSSNVKMFSSSTMSLAFSALYFFI